MNIEKANELVGGYLGWLGIEIKTDTAGIDNGKRWIEIKTPFLLTNRDLIEVYISETESGFELCDDGLVLNELELAGLDLKDPKFVRILTEQLNSSGVVREADVNGFGDHLRKFTTSETFPRAFHEFIQCILALDALSVVNRFR